MPAPLFTTNPGEFTRLEQVYVNEKTPPGFIRGEFLGVVGVAGETLRGPVDTPVEITSESRFVEVFGHRALHNSAATINQIRTFLMNKPFGRVVVVRAAAAAAAVAEKDFSDTDSVNLTTTADLGGAFNASGGPNGKGQITGAPASIDSVVTVAGNRILVKDQTNGEENGIYIVDATTTTLNRASDFDDDVEVVSNYVVDVLAGTVHAADRFRLTTADPIVVNTTVQAWTADGTGASVPVVNIAATSPGVWGTDLTVNIEAATDGDSTHWDLVVNYRGETTRYPNLDTTTGNNNLVEVLGTDLANLVVVTKLADGRPNMAYTNALDDTTGSDGTIADSDYTDTDRAIEQVARYKGVAMAAVAEASSSAVKAKMLLEAQASSDRLFLIWNGNHAETLANVIADAANYRSDRIVYVHNSTFTNDFEVNSEIQVPPHSWVASIMSQTDVDVHVGEESTKQHSAGIIRLQSENLSREDYISLREAGIASWEKDISGGFLIVSGRTTDLTPGREEITRRRMADFLQLSAANRLRFFVKKKNIVQNRAQMAAELIAFSQGLQNNNRVIEAFEVDNDVTTELERAQGIEKLLWRVKIVGHILHLVLETEIGTTVTFREAA